MSENPFTERYRNHSNLTLLKIVNNPTAYEVLAVEAAQKELSERNLSAEQFSIEQEKIAGEELQKQKQQEKLNAIGDTVKRNAGAAFDIVNPIPKEPRSVEQQLNLFCLYLLGIFLFELFTSYRMLIMVLSDFSRFDPSTFIFILPFVIFPLGSFLLWKRKKIGWFVVASYLTIITLGNIYMMLYSAFLYHPSGIASLDNFMRPTPALNLIWPCLFYGGGVYFLLRRPISEIFNLNRRTVWTTIAITFLAVLVVFSYTISLLS